MLKKLLYLSDDEAKRLHGSIFSSVVGQLGLTLPAFVLIAAFMEVLRSYFGGEVRWERMWILVGASIVVAVLVYLAQRYEYGKTFVVAYDTSAKRRTDLAEYLRKLPLSFFQKKDLTEITVNLMTDCGTMEQGFSSIFPQMLGTLITVIITCLLLAIYNWRMALAVLVTVPMAFGLLLLFRALHDKLGNEQLSAKLAASEQMQEYLEGMKVIKAYALGGERFESLHTAYDQLRRASFRHEAVSGSLSTVAMLIMRLGLPITLYAGLSMLNSGSLALTDFLVFLLFSNRVYTSLQGPLGMWTDFVYGILSIRRLQNVYDEPCMEGNDDVSVDDYTIEFRDVSFSYGADEVLHHVNFTAPQGKVTALVGPSGSGKSTVAKLAARFWDVPHGEVSIGGHNVKDIDPERLLGWISFAFQDVVLFNDTILNNIAIGRMGATREEVEEAAKLANCHDFIMKLPDGYDTVTGENGCTLSGGERQRLSIARALLKNAPIILLDEATASLDPENEVEIQGALSRLVNGKTVIVIAHRLRTISGADHIGVLEDGKVAEEGTHERLLQTHGVYEKLFRIQSESLGWKI